MIAKGKWSPKLVVLATFTLLWSGLWFAEEGQAATFSFGCPAQVSCPSSNKAGNMIFSQLIYNNVLFDFSWSATYSPHSGKTPNGAWITLTDGPMPMHNHEAAILYLDGPNNFVTAYAYDLDEEEDSWQRPSNFIGRFSNAVTFTTLGNGNVQQNLALNVGGINSFFSDPQWDGVDFGPGAGVWSAAIHHVNFSYDGQGRITNLSRGSGRTSWDRDDRDAIEIQQVQPIPEPGTLLLLSSGLAGLGRAAWRQKRRKT